MLGKKGTSLVIALVVAAVLLTGRARLALDDLTASFRNDFREMLYLPRGRSLRLVACGFDAPLADALFIKAMVYYAESISTEESVAAGRAYTSELFDVITDLSPRFTRAYQTGAVFLSASASAETNLKGCDLLQKGIDTFDRLTGEGETFREDPRWLFHSLRATTYEVDIQSWYRRTGDLERASEARELAAEEFRKAALSPGAPAYIQFAAVGYENNQRGIGDIAEKTAAVLSLWIDLYDQARARNDKELIAELEPRVEGLDTFLGNIIATRQLQEVLGQAGGRYMSRHGRAPRGVADLVNDGLVARPESYPMDSEEYGGDAFLALPDGTFRSRMLAELMTNDQLTVLTDAVIRYRRLNRMVPSALEDLVTANLLDTIPEPPLAKLGQVFEYNPRSGTVNVLLPLGPKLPPHLE